MQQLKLDLLSDFKEKQQKLQVNVAYLGIKGLSRIEGREIEEDHQRTGEFYFVGNTETQSRQYQFE